MLAGQGFRNVVWFVSIAIGPAIAYFLINILGKTSWICKKLHLCNVRLFVFFAVGFLGVWVLYWTCFLVVRAILGKKAGKTVPNAGE